MNHERSSVKLNIEPPYWKLRNRDRYKFGYSANNQIRLDDYNVHTVSRTSWNAFNVRVDRGKISLTQYEIIGKIHAGSSTCFADDKTCFWGIIINKNIFSRYYENVMRDRRNEIPPLKLDCFLCGETKRGCAAATGRVLWAPLGWREVAISAKSSTVPYLPARFHYVHVASAHDDILRNCHFFLL